MKSTALVFFLYRALSADKTSILDNLRSVCTLDLPAISNKVGAMLQEWSFTAFPSSHKHSFSQISLGLLAPENMSTLQPVVYCLENIKFCGICKLCTARVPETIHLLLGNVKCVKSQIKPS